MAAIFAPWETMFYRPNPTGDQIALLPARQRCTMGPSEDLLRVLLPLVIALFVSLALPAASQAELGNVDVKGEEEEDLFEGLAEDDEDLEDSDERYDEEEEEREDRRRRDEREEDDDTSWAEEEEEEDDPGLGRLSPTWFYAALGLTVATGIAAVVTGVMALQLNNLYLEEQDDFLLRERGMGLQTTTNVFIGVVSALGIATVLLGIFTDWSRGRDDDDDDDDDDYSSRLPQETLDQLFARSFDHRLQI